MNKNIDWVANTPSIELQILQYSLRHGYEDIEMMKERYKNNVFLKKETKKLDAHKRTMKKIFKRVNNELGKRVKNEKLEKCYPDRCHDKCSDNCTCGYCLSRKGFEALI